MYLHELKYKQGDIIRRKAWGQSCAHLLRIDSQSKFVNLSGEQIYACSGNGLGPSDLEANDWYTVSKVVDVSTLKHGDKFIVDGKSYLRWDGMSLLIKDDKPNLEKPVHMMEVGVVQTV